MAMPFRPTIGWLAAVFLDKYAPSLAIPVFFLGFLLSFASAASIQFTIASGQCIQGENVFNPCDNSGTGGMCASAPGVDKEWCCEPSVAVCGSWGETCIGGNGLAGPGQIFCQTPDSSIQWCCNAEYDVCVDEPDVFNLCRTKFSNPYKDTDEEEALSLKSAFFSTATSSSEEPSSTSAGRSSTTSAEDSSTTSAATSSTRNPPAETSTLPPNPDQDKEEDEGLSVGAKAGIAVGAVAAAALLGILVFFLLRQRRKGRQLQDQLNRLQNVPEMQGNTSAAQGSPWQQQVKYSGLDQYPPTVHEMGVATRPTELPGQTDHLVDYRNRP